MHFGDFNVVLSADDIVVGCLMYILQHELKRLKIELRNWNKNYFGNV